MMRMPWKRRIDAKHQAKPLRPAFRRALRFEQMEERLTLSTSAPVLSFLNDASLEGGWFTVDAGQALNGINRGVLDSDGLSSADFSVTNSIDHVLNYQFYQSGDKTSSRDHDETLLSSSHLNASILGGGLQQVIPIAPLEMDPPTQPDGGNIQIAQLFAPSFERVPGKEASEVLATTPLRGVVGDRAPIQEFAPTQGREIAFEVASSGSGALKRSVEVFESTELRGFAEETTETASPSSQPGNSSESQGVRHNSAEQQTKLAPGSGKRTLVERVSSSRIVPTSRVQPREIDESTEKGHEAIRDHVFAEWEEQRTSVIESPTAPIAKDRERQVTPAMVFTGVAALSAGWHYARTTSRDSSNEVVQLPIGSNSLEE